MREHMGLYRGKRIDNGEWVKGSLLLWPDGTAEICPVAEENANILDKITVDPDTVGECTGLKDKNGKLIFEGDVIKIPDDYDEFGMNAGEVYQVYFCCGGFRLKPKYSEARGYLLEDDNTVEVIGNVHDNPELLKGESNG